MSPDTEPRVLIPRTRLPADALSSQGRPPPDLLVGVSEGGVNVPAVSRSPGGVLIPAKSALEPVGVVESPTGELTLPEVMARLAAVEESKESGRQVSPQEQILFTFLPWKYLRKVAERVGWKAGTSLMPALERRFEEAELSYLFKSDKEEDIEKAFDRLETLSPTKMLAWLSHFTRMSNELIREKAKEFARRHSLSEMVTSDKKEIGIDSDFEIAAAWNADHDDSVIKPQKTSRNYGKRGGVVEVSIPSVFEQFLLEVVDDAQSIASSEPLSKKARLLKGATGIALQVADVVRYKYQTMTITAPQFVEKMATVLTTLEAAPNGESFEATWDLLSRFEIPVESAGELLAAMDKLHGLRHPLAVKLLTLLPKDHPFKKEQYRRVDALKQLVEGPASEVLAQWDELQKAARGIISIYPDSVPEENVGFDFETSPSIVGVPLPNDVVIGQDSHRESLPELRLNGEDEAVIHYDDKWRRRVADLWLWQETAHPASASLHLHVDAPLDPEKSNKYILGRLIFGEEDNDFYLNAISARGKFIETFEVRTALKSYESEFSTPEELGFADGLVMIPLVDFMIAFRSANPALNHTLLNAKASESPLKNRFMNILAFTDSPEARAAALLLLQSPLALRLVPFKDNMAGEFSVQELDGRIKEGGQPPEKPPHQGFSIEEISKEVDKLALQEDEGFVNTAELFQILPKEAERIEAAKLILDKAIADPALFDRLVLEGFLNPRSLLVIYNLFDHYSARLLLFKKIVEHCKESPSGLVIIEKVFADISNYPISFINETIVAIVDQAFDYLLSTNDSAKKAISNSLVSNGIQFMWYLPRGSVSQEEGLPFIVKSMELLKMDGPISYNQLIKLTKILPVFKFNSEVMGKAIDLILSNTDGWDEADKHNYIYKLINYVGDSSIAGKEKWLLTKKLFNATSSLSESVKLDLTEASLRNLLKNSDVSNGEEIFAFFQPYLAQANYRGELLESFLGVVRKMNISSSTLAQFSETLLANIQEPELGLNDRAAIINVFDLLNFPDSVKRSIVSGLLETYDTASNDARQLFIHLEILLERIPDLGFSGEELITVFRQIRDIYDENSYYSHSSQREEFGELLITAAWRLPMEQKNRAILLGNLQLYHSLHPALQVVLAQQYSPEWLSLDKIII